MTAAFRGKNKNPMGSYSHNPEELKARDWCMENNVCITPRQTKWGISSWAIDIETGRHPNRKLLGTSPSEYGPNTIWKQIASYQKYYYDKYKE